MTSDGPSELHLVGCEPLGLHGFALPLFGQRSRANTLYIAHCDPPGDHTGRITGFEPYEPLAQIWLPDTLQRPAAIGDAWLDVFLWGAPLATGGPAEIWEALEPRLNEFVAEAPLSLLDAAIYAARPDQGALAAEAASYVSSRFGQGKARRWRDTLMQRTVEVALAHAACDRPLKSDVRTALDALGVTVDGQENVVAVMMPPEELPGLEDVLAEVFAGLRGLAAGLELKLVLRSTQDASPAPATHLQAEPENPTAFSELFKDEPPVPGGPLIVAIGRRARAIARHLTVPEWRPENLHPVEKDGELWIDGRATGGSPVPVKVVTALGVERIGELQGQYPVVAVLVDDDQRDQASFRHFIDRLLAEVAAPDAARILVPALPEEMPSSAFVAAARRQLPQFDAMLDTAQARSPFWWGNPKRSLDRRIADIVMGGVLLAMTPEMRLELSGGRNRAPEVFTFAVVPLGSHSRQEEMMLASESTWVRRTSDRLRFSRQVPLVARRAGRADSIALIEGREAVVAFDEFAREALGSMIRDAGAGYRVSPGAPQANPDIWSAEGPVVGLGLSAPEHAVALNLSRRPDDLRLIVTAEVPLVESVAAARRAGRTIARYTDRETLGPLLTSPAQDAAPPAVPAEIRLPGLRSSPLNRRVATRGVDPRDVIRITGDQLQEWLAPLPPGARSSIVDRLRAIRPTGLTQAEVRSHAMRRKDLLAIEKEDPITGRRLRDILRLRGLDVNAPYKRAADLSVAWASPPNGLSRFAVLDGELPPVVLQLEPGEVVLQTAFVIDGDEGAPALFRSRPFAVWARATLARSSSWMSRFSVGATFGGFPLPGGFQIFTSGGEQVSLDSSETEPILRQLSAQVETMVERDLARVPEGAWKVAHRVAAMPPMRHIDELILRAYGLPADVDDLALLTRLIELNALL